MSSEQPSPSPFAALGLAAPLVRATADLGYTEPTPVQHAVIPAALAGRDVWACAQTGSGKTAAFLLPILERFARAGGRERRAGRQPVTALILEPTRELAAQVGEAVRALGAHLPARPVTQVVFGGVSINPQMLALRGGADVVVATPGRLLDLVSKNAVSLADVEVLVLDEADRLLEPGFADELGRLLALVPARRQTLLFSATFPPTVRALAGQVLRDPVRVELSAAPEDAPDIVQRAIAVDQERRTQLLRHLLAQDPGARALVFVATTHATGHVANKLRTNGVDAASIHGELSQGARTRALANFRAGDVRVLVATDVAARGLDIEGLPLVVNYDLPRSAADYQHRIGRTGRAGQAGVAISFVTAENEAHFRLIERRHGLDLDREVVPGFEPVVTAPTVATPDGPRPDPNGGVKGKRKSKKDKLREARES